MLDEARKQCLMAFALAGTHDEAKNCVKEVDARRFDEWSTQIEEKTGLVKQLGEAKAYEMAQNELKEAKTLSADARSKLRVLAPLDKGGSPADKRLMEAVQRFKTANASVATTETDLADRMENQWPRNLARAFGFQEGTPRVFAWAVTAAEVVLLAILLYCLALWARFAYRRFVYRKLTDASNHKVVWTVSAIVDDTGEAAVGAVMDALNVYYNPLFQVLPASSYLAVPRRCFRSIPMLRARMQRSRVCSM